MTKTNTMPWWKEPTRAQWSAFLAAWFGWVLDAFDFTIYILAVPEIAKEFGVSITVATGSVTLTLLVRLLGGVAAGWMADRWGRKLPLMLSILWFAAFDAGVALAPSFGVLLVLRTLFGFGMGAEWTSGTTLAMESWPERSRGIASGILQGSWAIGYLLAGAVSAFVIPHYGWRALFVIAALPALLVLPIRLWVKESDEWKKQRQQAAAAPRERLLSQGMIGSLLWASFVMALGFGVYYALVGPAYTAMLAGEHGLDAASRGTVLAVFNVGMLVGAIVTGTLAKRRGVRLAVVLPALLMIPLLPLFVGAVPNLIWLGAFLGGAVGVGFTGVVPLLLTNMFPAGVRGRSIGLVYHAGAFFAAFVPPAVTALSEHAGLSLAASIAVVAGTFEVLLAGSLLLRGRALEPQRAIAPPAVAEARGE